MTRRLTVAGAQLGPIARDEPRRAAASAIGRLNGYPEMDVLADAMLKDPDPVVRRAAHKAFHQISGLEFVFNPDAPEAERQKQTEQMRQFIPTIGVAPEKTERASGGRCRRASSFLRPVALLRPGAGPTLKTPIRPKGPGAAQDAPRVRGSAPKGRRFALPLRK